MPWDHLVQEYVPWVSVVGSAIFSTLGGWLDMDLSGGLWRTGLPATPIWQYKGDDGQFHDMVEGVSLPIPSKTTKDAFAVNLFT